MMTFDRPRAAVATAGFCAFLDLYAPQAVLPQLAESFHISPANAGGTIGISTLAVAVAAPFVGMLSDRFGRKITIVTAALLLAIPSFMLVFADGLTEVLVWRFIQGLLLPAVFSPTVAYVSETWSPGEAADVMGLYIAGSALGGFLGRFLTALLADLLGWRSGFLVLALITLIAAAVIMAWLPPVPARARTVERPAGAVGDFLDHLRNSAITATCLVGFAVLFSIVAVFTYINFHLAQAPYSLNASQLGMIFLVYPIGALAAPSSGFLIRRWGRRRTMALAASTSGAGLLATLQPSVPMIMVGLAFFVTGIFIMQSVAMGFVGQAARRAKATALGLYVCTYYIGGSAGAVLPGLLVWNRAGWPGCVAVVLMTLSGAAAMAWWAWRVKPALCPAE